MRVLQIGGTFVGAQQIIEHSIHHYLKEHGHESRILYAIGQSDDPGIIRYESRFDNLTRRALVKTFGKDHRFAFLSTAHLIQQIESYCPDLVHLHTIHHGYLDYEKLFTYLAKKQIPVVYTLHDMWSFTGGCYYYSDIQCNSFLVGCSECSKSSKTLDCKKSQVPACFQKKVRLFEQLPGIHFVAVSPWVFDEAKTSLLQKYPIDLIWNGIDPTNVPVTPVGISKNHLFTIIGVAGSWDERKGLSRFYELARLLGNDFQIQLIGRVCEEKQSGAPENIQFIGPVYDRAELAKLYATADIHVSMSLEETFGMTFVEAALAGIKSIGFDSSAVPQVITKVGGFIVPPADIEAMAVQISVLAKDRALCRLPFGEIARIRDAFSTARMAGNYLDLYFSCLRPNKQP